MALVTLLQLGAAHALHAPLFDSLRQSGGYVHPAVETVACKGRGTGLRIGKGFSIAQGEIVVGVPPALQLSWAAMAPTLGVAPAVNQLLPDPEQWDMRLAIALLEKEAAAKDSASFWSAYMASLPMSVPGMPADFNDAQLRAAARTYPALPDSVNARKSFLRALSEQLDCATPPLERAYAMVTSRAFRIDGDGAPGCMLPLIDLANHDFSPTGRLVRLGKPVGSLPAGTAALVSTRPLAAAEELTITYAYVANEQLLLDYGFEVANNPYNPGAAQQSSMAASAELGGAAAAWALGRWSSRRVG